MIRKYIIPSTLIQAFWLGNLRRTSILVGSLFMVAPSILADRIEDAVRASNFEDVNYLLIMKGGAVSQHRKDELVMLANEMTLVRKRGTIPVIGTVWDAYTTAKGVVASAIAIACAKRIHTVRTAQAPGAPVPILSGIQYGLFGAAGVIAGITGLVYLIDGVRSAHGRNLFDQAIQIEKRINELKVVGDSAV